MFELKIDRDQVEKCVEGVTFDKGDKLKIVITPDNTSTEQERLLTLESIEHYNGSLFILEFEELCGRYAFNLNQLLHFKVM